MLIPFVILAIPEEETRSFMENLYKKHGLLMRDVARSFFKSAADADDIVSDSCVRLIQHVDVLKGLSEWELKSYIVSTVRHMGIDHYRKQHRLQELFVPSSEALETLSADTPEPDQKILLEEELSRVLRAIRTLQPNVQCIMRMKFSCEMTDREIAEEMGLSVNSIAKYISRARKRLIEILYEDGGSGHAQS